MLDHAERSNSLVVVVTRQQPTQLTVPALTLPRPTNTSTPICQAFFFILTELVDMQEGNSSRHDAEVDSKVVEEYYKGNREGYNWRARLKMMWRIDEWGMPSPELDNVKWTTQAGFFGGAAYGAFHESAKVQRIFLEQNKYTMFQHPREAQRAMQDRVVLATFQGGWRAGWRMGLLGFTFSSVAQSLTAIRNYVNPLDYAVAGGVMGAVYKVGMGPKGMIGAGVGGAFLGLQGGVLVWGLQKLTGITVAERWHIDYLKQQEQNKEEATKKVGKDGRTQVVLKEADMKMEEKLAIAAEENFAAKIIVTVRKWLGDEGLEETEVQSNNSTEEISTSQKITPEKVQLEATPGLEAVKEGVR